MSASNAAKAGDVTSDLILAASAIFGGSSNSVPTRAGKHAIVKPATMAQLPPILRFFQGVMSGLDPVSLGALVDLVASAQKKAISEGKDPNKMDLTELTGEAVVRKAFGNVNLVTALFASVAEELPALIPEFTNLTTEEYLSMDPDEGIVLTVGIFTANYDFFSQKLPPILTAFMRSWAARNPGTIAQNQSVTSKGPMKRRR